MEAGKKSSKKSVRRSSKKQVKQKFSAFDLFLFMILAAFIGGSVIGSAKISLEVIPPFTLTFFIFLITYLITASIAGKNKQIGSSQFNDNFFPAFFVVANIFALFFALTYTTAVMVSAIYAIVPLVLIAYFKIFNNRRLVCDQKMGLLLGSMGLLLVVFQPIIQLCSENNLSVAISTLKGNALALVAVLFSVFYLLNRQKSGKKSVTPVSIVFYASLMAMAISVLPMLFIEIQDFNLVSDIKIEYIGMVLWMSITGVFLFHVIYQLFIKEKFTLAAHQYMQPVIGLIIAVFVLGEILPWLVIVGVVMMIVAGRIILPKVNDKNADKKKSKKAKSKTLSEKRKSEKLSTKGTTVEGGINKLGVFVLLLIAGATAGSIPTAGKIAMQTDLTPLALLFFRYVIAFMFMLPIIVKRNELSWNDLKNNFLPSFLAVMNPIVLFYALSYTTASVSILIYAAGPLFMALYHKLFCKAKLTQNQLIGLGVGFVGVALILFQPIAKGGVGTIVGNLMVIISTLFFVSYTIFSGKQQAKKLASPYSLVFYSSVVAMAISFIPMLQGIENVYLGYAQIGAIVWLGLVSTVIFFILFQFIVKREGTLVASVYAYLQATLGAIIGLVVLGETITLLIVFGAILTFVGAKIVTNKKTEENKKRKKPMKKTRKSAKKKTAKKSVKASKKVEESKLSEKKESKDKKSTEIKDVKKTEETKEMKKVKEGDVIQVRVIGGKK